MPLNWNDAMADALSRQMESLRDETDLNDDAIQAMAIVYSEGWKDCLRWLVSEGVIGNG